MISIKDIAEALSITPSTVSRALNGKKGVSKELGETILAKAAELGYKRNAVAQSLITQRTNTIGIVIPDITSRYYSFVVKGVNAYLEEHGYSVMLCSVNRSAQTEQRYLELLQSKRVDGILIISITISPQDLNAISRAGLPVVQIDNRVSTKLSAVINDNYSGAALMAEHLVAMGCRHIACMMGLKNNETTIERERGLREVLKKHGLTLDEKSILYINATPEEAYLHAPELLRQQPDAIFAINDMAAMGIMRCCLEHGIKIPQDLRLSGYDDLDIAGMMYVPLTTVHQHKVSLGRAAAKLLLEEIQNPEAPHRVITLLPELKVRLSCGEALKTPPRRLHFKEKSEKGAIPEPEKTSA